MTYFNSPFRRRTVKPVDERPAQQYRDLPDGGYEVLHPTKGWRRVSGARLRAQAMVARLKGVV